MPAKPSVIPGTIFDFTLRIDVQEWALFVVAGIESRIEITFRHLGHVVFVQEFTLIALFAQATKPMFAYNSAIATYVSEGTGQTVHTFGSIVPVEKLTNRSRWLWRQCLYLRFIEIYVCWHKHNPEHLLSMPGNGNGNAPNCSFKSLSILNSMWSTLAIIKSMFSLKFIPTHTW